MGCFLSKTNYFKFVQQNQPKKKLSQLLLFWSIAILFFYSLSILTMIGFYFFFCFMNLGFNKKNTKYTKIKCPFWSKITTKNEIIFNHRIVSSYQKDIEYDDSKLLWVFTVCMCVVYQNKVSNWISAFFSFLYIENTSVLFCGGIGVFVCVWDCVVMFSQSTNKL